MPHRMLAVYTDYKSPDAFLAKDLTYEVAREFPGQVAFLPYVLDVPSAIGSAELDSEGRVVRSNRSPHQWRRVRYAYMDCRREAKKRGLTLRASPKIWDSALAAVGMLYAQRQGEAVFRAYHDRVFERLWKRELDIEDSAAIAGVLGEAGADTAGFPEYLGGEGRAELNKIQTAAEAAGVFGVPSFVIDGELFWGREHLADIRDILRATA